VARDAELQPKGQRPNGQHVDDFVGQSNQHKKALVPIVAFSFPARAVVVVRSVGNEREIVPLAYWTRL
jgi:hypothetical protein